MKYFKKSILQFIIAILLCGLMGLSERLMLLDGEIYFLTGAIIGAITLIGIFILILYIMDHINTMVFKNKTDT
jgi:hypothetical protein